MDEIMNQEELAEEFVEDEDSTMDVYEDEVDCEPSESSNHSALAIGAGGALIGAVAVVVGKKIYNKVKTMERKPHKPLKLSFRKKKAKEDEVIDAETKPVEILESTETSDEKPENKKKDKKNTQK